MKYQLIAFDMDGTLLTSDKRVTDDCRRAIREAAAAGKDVAICTGRPLAEMHPYDSIFSDIRYYICECGALISDRESGRIIVRHTLSPEIVGQILGLIPKEDIMPQAMIAGESFVNRRDIGRMEHYNMGVYASLYDAVATRVDDVASMMRKNPEGIEKINLYHASVEARERTRARLTYLQVPVEMRNSETSTLEVSPAGYSKGTGLAELASILHIPMAETIGVGDADNDLPLIEDAGLGLAMGNGSPEVREAADAVLPDCDHNGCAAAIWQYLLAQTETV